ncbi:MAG: MurR/RpiR family transcriptional regulator [Candidatus Competibacterales bacterium]
MATGVLTNVEQTLAGVDVPRLRAAAKAIVEARRTYVMGVGINYGVARSFAYLAAMVLDQVQAIPQEGHWAVDDLSEASGGDVLVALTFKPYRREVLEAVAIAKDQGVDIIGLSDSPASPLVANAEHGLVVATETPQFFTSTVAASALLETLMAFVIAAASPEAIARIERLQARRRALGLYRDDEGG